MRDDRPANVEAPDSRWRTSLLVPLAIVLVVSGIIAGIISVSRQEQDTGGAALAGGSLDTAGLSVTVPYREMAGAIIIDVTLGEGERTLPMILDTGAPTIVTERVAETFAGDAVGTVSSVSIDGQVQSSDVVVLPRVAIGDAVFREVGAVVGQLEPGNPFACLSDAGFIGASLMRTATWQIDSRSQTVTISSSVEGLEHIDGATRLEFVPASDVVPSPLVELAVGEGALTFLLDTGANGWLALNPRDLRDVDVELPDDAPSVALLGSGAAGAFATQARWLDAGAGPASFPLATLDVLPENQGNAGTDYLSRFIVTIDWPAGVVYLEPIAAAVPSTPMSASLAWDDGLVIGSFVEGLAGDRGLALRDKVLAIDGEDVTTVTFDDFCGHLTSNPAEFEVTVAGEPPTRFQVAPVEDFFSPLGD